MNKTILTGRLTADAVFHTTEKSVAINFTVANNDASYKNDEGEWVNVPVFVECVLWKKKDANLDWAKRSLTKGVEILVEGVSSANAYISKDDNKVKSFLTIKVDRYQTFALRVQGTATGGSIEQLEQNVVEKADNLPF
ncbi:MAG: single-stranded DNA-binding protein [Bacteroides sp.]|uniref:single-stranded DNA-binding protein n=1 Tax=Bacteroides sp. TaxID=29523 RepID=UPI002FC737DE